MKILVLNAGSSSQKSRLYEIGETLPGQAPQPLWSADADWLQHSGKLTFTVTTAHGATLQGESEADSRKTALEYILATLWSGQTRVIDGPQDIDMVGHRVVQGGPKYTHSAFITPEVKAEIGRLSTWAPLHNPLNLEGINAAWQVLPSIPEVAVFDTAFHCQIPLPIAVYPGPYSWYEQGMRRYGFHGISYQYCSRRAGQLLNRDPASLRLIACHLGNGCSLAAIQGGRSIDTSMGFTPLEGLMMGTRSGSVDPGILIYLLREHGYSADQLDQMLNKQSGLLGISGSSSDMREILASRKAGDERAKLAFDMFVYRLRFYIGAMLATLGGLDALIFTAGIGEHSPEVRSAACEHFAFMGLELDEQKNAQSPVDQDIATAASTVRVLVIHTEEDWEIARECWRLAQEEKKA
ncbi:MAG TPA: acetate kinase [Ktedonobacteraceae bacterium]|nr:acetate kinase [Ktedonobacteraceae bacterium]